MGAITDDAFSSVTVGFLGLLSGFNLIYNLQNLVISSLRTKHCCQYLSGLMEALLTYKYLSTVNTRMRRQSITTTEVLGIRGSRAISDHNYVKLSGIRAHVN